MSESRIERVVRLYKKGKSLRSIATQYNKTHVTIRRWLLDAGVSLRSRGRRRLVKA